MGRKWLDNYGQEDNYNDSKISLPKGFVGQGYDISGINYSPAWEGQFQSGGNIESKWEYSNTNGKLIPQSQLKDSELGYLKDWLSSPMAKKIALKREGESGLNNLDENSLQQLDQLTNFTNYNKLSNGGWLDKF